MMKKLFDQHLALEFASAFQSDGFIFRKTPYRHLKKSVDQDLTHIIGVHTYTNADYYSLSASLVVTSKQVDKHMQQAQFAQKGEQTAICFARPGIQEDHTSLGDFEYYFHSPERLTEETNDCISRIKSSALPFFAKLESLQDVLEAVKRRPFLAGYKHELLKVPAMLAVQGQVNAAIEYLEQLLQAPKLPISQVLECRSFLSYLTMTSN